MPPLAPDVRALLDEHAAWISLNEDGQVVCSISGHAMPPRAPVILQYLSGKKYAALRAKQQEQAALKQYEPHLLPSKYCSGFLFCRITGRLVPAKEAAVLRHSEGRRFKVGLAFAQAGASPKEELPPAAAAAAAAESEEDDAIEEEAEEEDGMEEEDEDGEDADEAEEEEEEEAERSDPKRRRVA